MVVELRSYGSVKELVTAVDNDLAKAKSQLGEHLRKFDEIRVLAERSRKLKEVILKAAGGKDKSSVGDGVKMGDIQVILDVRPEHEMMVLEEVVRGYQDRINALQKTREVMKGFEQVREEEDNPKGISCLVLSADGVPHTILVKLAA